MDYTPERDMIIIDEQLLAEFSEPGPCEWCGEHYRDMKRDPHHVFARGVGGGSRIDHRINLMSLCRQCHFKAHTGQIQRWELIRRVAIREGLDAQAIEMGIFWIRRQPKDTSLQQLQEYIAAL